MKIDLRMSLYLQHDRLKCRETDIGMKIKAQNAMLKHDEEPDMAKGGRVNYALGTKVHLKKVARA